MNNSQYQKGDFVVYGTNGVCFVEDIKPVDFSIEKNQLFYILKPESNKSSTYYVPLNNKKLCSKMRTPMTKKEIDLLLEKVQDNEVEWIEDKVARNHYFQDIILGCEQEKLIPLVHCINLKKEELIELGKKLSNADDIILQSAERLVKDELSHSLNISTDDVENYVKDSFDVQ